MNVPAAEWETAELRRNTQPLPLSLRRLGGAVRVLAEWPRSGTGSYALALRTPAGEHRRVVTIHPEKLSPASFAGLLEDLELHLPAAIAVAIQHAGGLAGVELLPPELSTVAEELLRLRRAVEGTANRAGLSDALAEIAHDPHVVLHTRELWVRRAQARRPHPARLVQAWARPGNLDLERRPERVLDTRVEHSTDVYENRLVRTFVEQVQQRLRRLARLPASASSVGVRSTVAALARRMAAARREAAFLESVAALEHAPQRVTMVLLRRPGYHAALEGLLEFQRSVAVRLDAPALDAPLENAPALYQLWGTLQVIHAALAVAGELGYQVIEERLVRRTPGAAFLRVLPDGRPAVLLRQPVTGVEVRIVPERTYRKHGGEAGLWSTTYEQRPDLAVEVLPPDGPASVYLFDPKYKLDSELLESAGGAGKPKKVDIDKMHAYRDAIRDRDGRHAVRYAAILYPGPEQRFPYGVEALTAYPGSALPLVDRLQEVLREALR
ncbi:MAG TPA: DUF2357 domain-containing protein [Longimicrobium sp.]|uniref:DUF2357 domain-containing protein n=1 Tax=Longimicrobium sp. TaxID=2029185 RepID=UPI002EDB0711